MTDNTKYFLDHDPLGAVTEVLKSEADQKLDPTQQSRAHLLYVMFHLRELIKIARSIRWWLAVIAIIQVIIFLFGFRMR